MMTPQEIMDYTKLGNRYHYYLSAGHALSEEVPNWKSLALDQNCGIIRNIFGSCPQFPAESS